MDEKINGFVYLLVNFLLISELMNWLKLKKKKKRKEKKNVRKKERMNEWKKQN
jgi:folate-dependent tRNA-U54 methylase TrmFO/GidA